MRKILATIMMAVLVLPAMADEGMWIPMLLGKNQAAMQKAGMRITAQDIYDINNACLKDAIILFNQGCTGEYVSDEGLFLTNHHCGYSYITSHSTVEHDYLTNGFWAMNRKEELPCPGLTATRLVRMEDVTNQVLEGIDANRAIVDFRMWAYDWHISKIIPLAHNVDFAMTFLMTRFPELKDLFVPAAGRDTMRFASVINDLYKNAGGHPLFSSMAFRSIRKVIGMPGEQSHRAFDDAREAAFVYRTMMSSVMPAAQMRIAN